jgi:hypothetical protein
VWGHRSVHSNVFVGVDIVKAASRSVRVYVCVCVCVVCVVCVCVCVYVCVHERMKKKRYEASRTWCHLVSSRCALA